jgi:NAD(P)-dependent dehydrogenase (short-subunit alcohol dehydrogenase family)
MAKQPRPLAGKVVAITGAGRGIGRATAAALAAKGARIAVADLDAAAAEQAATELGPDHAGIAVDVTDAAAFTAFLDDVERRLGPIDVLINNAGIMPVTPLAEEDDASVTRQLELNLHAVIRGTQEAIRRMVPRRSGHIVNIASLAGRSGFPNLATYCATKHGVVGLSEAVRAELRGTGVEISVVMPGLVRTELIAGLKDARGVKTLAPEDVANEIVSALEVPRCASSSRTPSAPTTPRARPTAARAPPTRPAPPARPPRPRSTRRSAQPPSHSAIVAPMSGPWSSCRK